MYRIIFILVLISSALSACTSQVATVSSPGAFPTDTILEEITNPTVGVTPQEIPNQLPPPSNSVTTFEIISKDSQVKYEVGETFFNQGNVFATAIGITKAITGDVTIDFSNPQNSTVSPIIIDINQFSSDSNRRDNAIRDRFLESASFPTATFTPTKVDGLPPVGQEGVDYPLKITGDLTIKETTKPVTFDATVRLDGDTLTGSASTTILMSEFGVGPISLAGILETEDEVKLTLTFVAQPVQ